VRRKEIKKESTSDSIQIEESKKKKKKKMVAFRATNDKPKARKNK
jgi:hypothetical protein